MKRKIPSSLYSCEAHCSKFLFPFSLYIFTLFSLTIWIITENLMHEDQKSAIRLLAE